MNQNLPEIQKKLFSVRDYFQQDKIKKQFMAALPKWLDFDRFFRVVWGELLKNPKLGECTLESLLRSVMACAILGIEPILGRGYLIPYNNNKQIDGRWQKVLECQFQPGYQGIVDLVRRSGEIANIGAWVVFENDDYDLDLSRDYIPHKPYLKGDRGDPVFAYTQWKFKDGIRGFDFMTIEDIHKRRAMSQAYQFAMKNPKNADAQKTPWLIWSNEMMAKTALKTHCKILPMSIHAMQAISYDNQLELTGTMPESFGLPAIDATPILPTPPERKKPEPAEFDAIYKKGIMAHPKWDEFWEATKDGNRRADGSKMDDDELKVEILESLSDIEDLNNSFWGFVGGLKNDKSAKKDPKKSTATKGKAQAKKSSKSADGGADAGKKEDAQAEFEFLQQSDEWQEMSFIFENYPILYKKYKGKNVKTFDDAQIFLNAVAADPEYKKDTGDNSGDEIPGA